MSMVALEQEQSSLRLWGLEVAKIESELTHLQAEIQAMLDDPNAPIATMMRKNAERAELQAYLKGLKFLAPLLDPSLL